MKYPLNINIHLDIQSEQQAVELINQLTEAFGLVWKKDIDAISKYLLGHIFVEGDTLASIWYFDEEAYVEEVLNQGQGLTIQFCEYNTIELENFNELLEEAKSAANYIETHTDYEPTIFVSGGHPV